jgi:hypothetical protein
MYNEKNETLCKNSGPRELPSYSFIFFFSSQKHVQCKEQDKGTNYK